MLYLVTLITRVILDEELVSMLYLVTLITGERCPNKKPQAGDSVFAEFNSFIPSCLLKDTLSDSFSTVSAQF